MTDKERANRNPAPELCLVKPDQHPLITDPGQLERYKIYLIEGAGGGCTLNYAGLMTDGPRVFHLFVAPRSNFRGLALWARPEGGFRDSGDTPITVRRWLGEDA